MAEMLKREFGLLTLKVAFDAALGDNMIEFALERYEAGTLCYRQAWPVSGKDILAQRDCDDGDFFLPDMITTALPLAIRAAGGEDEPLWLHLVKPYGLLGLLPWEGALTRICSRRSVLRLPDFLARPCENAQVLNAAILWNLSCHQGDVALLDGVVDTWLATSGRPAVAVHLFVGDVDLREHAHARWADQGARVTVHDLPPRAAPNGVPDKTTYPALFAQVEGATAGVTFDAVHLVCDGQLGTESSALLLMPEGACDRTSAQFGTVADLTTFLNRLGSWATVITPPRHGHANGALRHFSDALAQARPGATMFHTLSGEGAGDLAIGCRLMFSEDEVDHTPFASAFLYCPPALVSTAAAEATPRIALAPQNDVVFGNWADSEGGAVVQAPAWVSAAQRIVEEISLDRSRDLAGDNQFRDLLSQQARVAASMEQTRSSDVVQQALDDIQSIVRMSAVESMAKGSTSG